MFDTLGNPITFDIAVLMILIVFRVSIAGQGILLKMAARWLRLIK